MKAVITAGGKGTRLRPLTYSMNKHLIPIANTPIIASAIQDCVDVGIREILININAGDTEMPSVIGDGSKWGVQITYQEQDEPRGLGHLLKLAEDFVGDDPFVFYYGDNIFTGSLHEHIEAWKKAGTNFHLCLVKVPDPERFGVAVVEGDRIVRSVEKPQEFISDLAITGIQFYDKQIFEALKHTKPTPPKAGRTIAEMDIPPANQWLIDNGFSASFSVIDGWWKDTGTPEALLEGNRLTLDARTKSDIAESATVESSVAIEGHVEIYEDAQILGNTTITGPVTIGRGTIIRDCNIGPHTAIGHEAEVSGAHISNSIIMDAVDIRTTQRIHNSLIGHNATITDAAPDAAPQHELILGEHSQVQL